MKTVLYVCVHNAGRSQMAEAFTNVLAQERGLAVRALSAGTMAGEQINPTALAVMLEAGISMDGQKPKQLTQELADSADRVVTMGCGVEADVCPARIHLSEDWGLDDPKGQPVEKVRAIRDQIRAKVETLLAEMGASAVQNAMFRRYAAEGIGTFGIVFAPVALSASGHLPGGDSGLMAAAWVSGLSVLAMIYALGHISAAHFNPAVTLGFAVAGRFPWRYVLPYWIAEFAGGIAAAGLAALLFGAGHGAHVPAPGPLSHAVGIEAVLTFFLMLVIISVATDRRANGAIPGLAIGLTVVFDVTIGGPITGGSMNPARSLGPALFAGGAALSSYWLYVAGPFLGAVTAARLYEAIRGGEHHAQSAPNDLAVALSEIEATVGVH